MIFMKCTISHAATGAMYDDLATPSRGLIFMGVRAR